MKKIFILYSAIGIALVFCVLLILPSTTFSQTNPTFTQVTVAGDANDDEGRTTIGDIDGDGFNDIVVHRWGSNLGDTADGTLKWYEYPSWTEHLIKGGVNFYGDDVVIVDLDGDGDNDVVAAVGNRDVAEVWWYENNGSSSNWPAAQISTTDANTEVKDIRVADMDHDGKLDVVSRSKLNVTINYQNSKTSWQQVRFGNNASSSVTTPQREGMALGDIDADGDQDIVLNGYWRENPRTRASSASSWPAYIIDSQWYTQSGGGFRDNAVSAATGDMDNDGKLDVAYSHAEHDGYNLTWYETTNPKGGSSAWQKHELGIVHQAETLRLADFNKDGMLDILTASLITAATQGTYIFYNNNNGASFTRTTISSNSAYKASVGDIDNDGDSDIVTARAWDREPIYLYRNNLDPDLTLPLDQWIRRDLGTMTANAVFARHADLNGDGLIDLAAGKWWWRNPGTLGGSWSQHTIGLPLNNVALVHDFDNDGDIDIFGTQGSGAAANHNFAWAENNGSGLFTIHTNISTGGTGDFLQGVLIEDFGQGKQIVMSWHNEGGGVQAVTIPSNPKTQQWPFTVLSTTTQGEDLSSGDIDRDGDKDLLLGTQWLQNNGGSWTAHTIDANLAGLDSNALPDRNALVDVNSDGRLDAIVSLELGELVLWYEAPTNPVTGTWTRRTIGISEGQGFSMGTGDFDQDGDIDVTIGEHRNEQVYGNANRVFIFENNNTGGSWIRHIIDSSSTIDHHDGNHVADLDSDGDLDIYSIGWYNRNITIYENRAKTGGGMLPTNTPVPPTPTSGVLTPTPIPGVFNKIPASHWKFDEGTGLTAADSSGSNTGTVNGALWTSGNYDQALQFDGTDDYVSVGSFGTPFDGISFSAWVKADSFLSPSSDNRIISKATGSATDNDHLFMISTIQSGGSVRPRFRLKIDGITQALIASQGNIPVGQWVHVAATYDGSTMKLYQDGTEVGSRNATGIISTDKSTPVNIGRNPVGGKHWHGAIDDVRMYGSALTAEDVQHVMNNVSSEPRKPGDVDGNSLVNIVDLSSLLSTFGTSVSPNTGADFNGDGIVNISDLSTVLANFGK